MNTGHVIQGSIDVMKTYMKQYSIMMLMKFSDLSQSDCSNWVMWQVGDLKIKMFAEGWVVYPRTSGSPEPTWHEARSAEYQVGSGDPRGLEYTTQPSANILIFIIAHVLQLIYTI